MSQNRALKTFEQQGFRTNYLNNVFAHKKDTKNFHLNRKCEKV